METRYDMEVAGGSSGEESDRRGVPVKKERNSRFAKELWREFTGLVSWNSPASMKFTARARTVGES